MSTSSHRRASPWLQRKISEHARAAPPTEQTSRARRVSQSLGHHSIAVATQGEVLPKPLQRNNNRMSARRQPQADQKPLIPSTAEPSIRRPTADEWFHAVSEEPPLSAATVTEPPSIPATDPHVSNRRKAVLAALGALALLGIAAIGVIWTLTTNDGTSDLAKCDTWLRTQFVNHPEIITSTQNANAAVVAIQDQRTADCPRNAWNPLVSSITKTREGSIEVTFVTVGRTSNGQPVTMPAAGKPRWIYLAAETGGTQRPPATCRP